MVYEERENMGKEVNDFITEYADKKNASELADFVRRENAIIQKIYAVYDKFLKSSPELMDVVVCHGWVYDQREKIHGIFCEKIAILTS